MDKRQLMKQCKSGDREAFGILYQTYFVPMRNIVAYYVNRPDVVKDILHDGFLIAFASINSLKDAEKVDAWLTTIMKNLALQYLKEKSNPISVPLSDVSVAIDAEEDNNINSELTWDELNQIIDRLPNGYGKVFRLAVLDGLSHKRIGEMLGIAPHSSSSQLTHAKAMLRRMITEYRIEMGILPIIAIILLVWNEVFKHLENTTYLPAISKKSDNETPSVAGSLSDDGTKCDGVIPKSKTIYKIHSIGIQEHIAEVTLPTDSVTVVQNDSVVNGTLTIIPSIMDKTELIAQENLPGTMRAESLDWSLSLAYSGALGQNDRNRFGVSDLPDVEGPSGVIKVTEKSRHHVPLIIGLSMNKSLTSRWSIETGIRYTYLRSDFLSESELAKKETIQRIHYIGVPLKFNCRVFSYNGFSLYGHGGGALDIPVYGNQSVWEFLPESGTATTDLFRTKAPLQWSAEGGLGIQYQFTPLFSIYAEPSLRYYFNPGSDIKTIRQEKPFEFTIPIGLKLTW